MSRTVLASFTILCLLFIVGFQISTPTLSLMPTSTPDWCEIGVPYRAVDGLTVTLNSFTIVEKIGSYQFIITYTLENENMDIKISEGSFKMYYRDSTGGLPQYGFFGDLFPGDTITRSYTFEELKSKPFDVLEYHHDNFFSPEPLEDSLKWKVEIPYDDDTPPITLDDYDGLWHNADFTITLTATDNGSGVAETYYRINNGSIRSVNVDGQPSFWTVQTGAIIVDGNVSDWIALGLSPLGTDPPNNIEDYHDISSDLLEAWAHMDPENLFPAMKVNGEGTYNFDRIRYRVYLGTDMEDYNVAYFDWDGEGIGRLFYWDEDAQMWQMLEYIDTKAGFGGYIEWKVPLILINNSTSISLDFVTIDDYYSEEVNRIHGIVSSPHQLPPVPEGSNHTLEYWSEDYAGNEELHKLLTGIKIDKTAPTIGFPSLTLEGDIQPNQDVKVSVNITDFVSAVKNVTLSYNLNDSVVWTDLPVALNSTTGLYEAIIPGQQANTLVKYRIAVYDNAGNYRVEDNSGQYFVYTVIPEFPSFLILPLFMIATLLTVILYRRKLES